jgi:hypothetical protein
MTATKAFSSAELTAFGVAQTDHYNDTCQVGILSESQDSTGFPVPTYTYGTAIECGFNPIGGRERESADKTVLRSDAQVRLPIGTVISQKDQVKIITRHGSTLSPSETYQVSSLPKRGPSGLYMDLVRVDA